MYRYYDLYHGRPDYDYSEYFRGRHQPPPAQQRPTHPRPPAPLAQYAGSYSHPVYGLCQVKVVDQQLVARLGKISLNLAPWDTDTFSYADPMDASSPPGFASFDMGPDGKADELRLDLTDDVLEGRFQRKD